MIKITEPLIELYYKRIIDECTDYIRFNKIRSLVIGISGGLDSAVNTIISNVIAKSLGIPLYGYFISIESNKPEEEWRANAFSIFCDSYKNIDLTNQYIQMKEEMDKTISNPDETDFEKKVRYGNIKARLRMIYLYNAAQAYKGIVLDNDNKTERNLGFWTLHGDVGDIVPLASLWKTEVYALARYLKENICQTPEEKDAIQIAIDAIPTDGLGITSSDLEQLGANTYEEVDNILSDNEELKQEMLEQLVRQELYKKYDEKIVDNIIDRNERTWFKRSHPHRVIV